MAYFSNKYKDLSIIATGLDKISQLNDVVLDIYNEKKNLEFRDWMSKLSEMEKELNILYRNISSVNY